jgi:hypothetical protein
MFLASSFSFFSPFSFLDCGSGREGVFLSVSPFFFSLKKKSFKFYFYFYFYFFHGEYHVIWVFPFVTSCSCGFFPECGRKKAA